MGYKVTKCPDLVIASSGTTSNVLGVEISDAEVLVIYTPAALDTGTYTFQGAPASGGTFVPLYTGSANLTFDQTLTSRAYPITLARGVGAIRLVGPTAAATRTFLVTKFSLVD